MGERTSELTKVISVETFIQDISDFLTAHDSERIRHLVYLDALLLQSGQKVFDIIPPEMAAARRELAMQTSQGLSLPVPDPAVFGVTDEVDVKWVKENCTPHPLSTYETIFGSTWR